MPCLLLNPGEPALNAMGGASAAGALFTIGGAPLSASPATNLMILDPSVVAEALEDVAQGGDDADIDGIDGADLQGGDDTDGINITGRAQPAEDAATMQQQRRERVLLHLVGEGTGGAMALDPPTLELGVVRVGHKVGWSCGGPNGTALVLTLGDAMGAGPSNAGAGCCACGPHGGL